MPIGSSQTGKEVAGGTAKSAKAHLTLGRFDPGPTDFAEPSIH